MRGVYTCTVYSLYMCIYIRSFLARVQKLAKPLAHLSFSLHDIRTCLTLGFRKTKIVDAADKCS
jgi:hypothetical protein